MRKLSIENIEKDSIQKSLIASFASIDKGRGALFVSTNLLTKEVTFIVEGNNITITKDTIEEAIEFYNLIIP